MLLESTIFEDPVSIAADVWNGRVICIYKMVMLVIGNFQEEEQGIEGGGDIWKEEMEMVVMVSSIKLICFPIDILIDYISTAFFALPFPSLIFLKSINEPFPSPPNPITPSPSTPTPYSALTHMNFTLFPQIPPCVSTPSTNPLTYDILLSFFPKWGQRVCVDLHAVHEVSASQNEVEPVSTSNKPNMFW